MGDNTSQRYPAWWVRRYTDFPAARGIDSGHWGDKMVVKLASMDEYRYEVSYCCDTSPRSSREDRRNHVSVCVYWSVQGDIRQTRAQDHNPGGGSAGRRAG